MCSTHAERGINNRARLIGDASVLRRVSVGARPRELT